MSTILEIDTEDLVRGARFVKPALDRARGDHPALHLNHADLRLRDGKLQLTDTNGRVLLTWELEHKLVDLNQDKWPAYVWDRKAILKLPPATKVFCPCCKLAMLSRPNSAPPTRLGTRTGTTCCPNRAIRPLRWRRRSAN